MKKSQLKKIIRESIKELITEQWGPIPSSYCNQACHNTPNSQQACSNVSSAISMSSYGINQNYHNNLMNAYNNNGCNALLSKRNDKAWQMYNLINNGLNSSFCAGDNPIQQSQLYNRARYANHLHEQLCT